MKSSNISTIGLSIDRGNVEKLKTKVEMGKVESRNWER
jgi:hypothetical protein